MPQNDIYDGLRTVSRYARKACGKGFLGVTLFFVKNRRFLTKNSVTPIDYFQGRFLSVAKKSQ